MGISKKLRQEVYNKFNGLCAYSGTPLEDDWQVEHIRSKLEHSFCPEAFELNHIDNLLPVQRILNHYKRSLTLEEFRDWYLGGLHERLKKLPRKTNSPKTIKRKEYLLKVAKLMNITEQQPFNGQFYFETIEEV